MAKMANRPPITSRYQLSRLMLREGQVARADHHRQEEVAQRRRDGGDQEEEDHHHAVHGEQLVIGVRRDQVALRRQQLDADQRGEGAADEEEQRDREQVEQRDALVVLGQQPRLEAVARRSGNSLVRAAAVFIVLLTGSRDWRLLLRLVLAGVSRRRRPALGSAT